MTQTDTQVATPLDVVHLEVLVEEYSAEAALSNLLPRLLPARVEFNIRTFRGKTDLLKKLPNRLKGYQHWPQDDLRILVLCDRDDDDCLVLKQKLEDFATQSGFTTRSTASNGQFLVLNRIIVEELEAWFFGDANALSSAYPKIKKTFATQSKYRLPDEISGGTWEALERLLQSKGYHPGGLNKVQAARDISFHMKPERNRSDSFQCFCTGLEALVD